MSPIYDKYTDRAKRALALATEEARRFNHNYIGTEHLLLGLVREGENIAAKALLDRGVDLKKARSAVEFIIGRGERVETGDISLTPRAKKAIEYATEEARRLGHDYIGAEHLLLGLAREGEGIAVGILESLSVDLAELGAAVETASGKRERAGQAPPTGRAQRAAGTDIALTPNARRALAGAADEARRLGHDDVGAGHLLLALVRESDGFAAGVLQAHGVDLEKLRRQVKRAVSQGDTS